MEQRETSPCRTLVRKTAAIAGIAALTMPFGITQNPPAPVPPPSLCSRNINVLSLLPGPAGRGHGGPGTHPGGGQQQEQGGDEQLRADQASLVLSPPESGRSRRRRQAFGVHRGGHSPRSPRSMIATPRKAGWPTLSSDTESSADPEAYGLHECALPGSLGSAMLLAARNACGGRRSGVPPIDFGFFR